MQAHPARKSDFIPPPVEGDFYRIADLLNEKERAVRLRQLQSQGLMTEEHASLAKAYCTVKRRETVGWARGNGIPLDNHIGRFVADAEAISSYEGTREMNTVIVRKFEHRLERLRLTQTHSAPWP